MNIKTTSLVLTVVAGLFASGCASTRNSIPLDPVSFSGQATSAITSREQAIACAELAGMRCHMTKVSADGHTLVTLLDYPRCQIRFTSTFTVNNDLSYSINLKEIQMEGKGHNYTVSYINRVLSKWSREIQAQMLRSQIAQ